MKNNAKIKPILSTTITGMSHDGRGIAIADDGKTTFVQGALPTEKVVVELSKRHARYNEATTLEILEPSVDRTPAICAHFGVCGGCSLQHIEDLAQIRFKQQVVLEQLAHFGHVKPDIILPPITAKTVGYRRKARLGVRYVHKKEKLLIGFREKSSRYLADIETCQVLHPDVGMKLPLLREVVASLDQFECIPQIEVAIGDYVRALVFRHLENLTAADKATLKLFAKTHDFHLYLQPNPPAAIEKLWPEDTHDRLTYSLPDYSLTFEFHPLDFTQVNGDVNPLMIKAALNLLEPEPSDTILDLFCGLGNFTLPMAKSAKKVVGVEGSEMMVMRATHNASINNITNTSFFAANLADIPATKPAWMQTRYDKILLDPPRTGAKEIIAHFSDLKAKRIVYVSCNPATLARDAEELVHQQGYRLKSLGVINMFPHTSHIETIALFEK